MPNWCSCILKVEGPAKEIIKFKKKAKGRGPNPQAKDKELPLSLHALVPQPIKFRKEGSDWFMWRVAHWGTKWDVASHLSLETANTLEYRFDAAWSPPLAWAAKIGPKFPKLSFRLWYAEGGVGFAGVLTVEGSDSCNEEKDYVEAHIEEYGGYGVECSYCDSDMEISQKDALRVCEDCLKFRCAACDKHQDAHLEDEKCPFDATVFKNISAEKIE